MILKECWANLVLAVGKNGMKEWKNTSFMFWILCFSDGVIECILWKVLKFMSFCLDFAKSLVLGHELIGCGLNFVSFGSWKCWNFMGFMDFWVSSLPWSHELKSWCRISCLSLTGKAQNSQENWKMHEEMVALDVSDLKLQEVVVDLN